jgi:hypothetical protein
MILTLGKPLAVSFLSLFLLAGCDSMFHFFKSDSGKPEKAVWGYSESAHYYAPMGFINTHILLENERKLTLKEGDNVNSLNWGNRITSSTMSKRAYGTPVGLEVNVYSVIENVFYTGKFDFDVEYVKQLLHTPYALIDEEEEVMFRLLTVGGAPNGFVSVWLSGRRRRIEIFHGQLEPYEQDWEEFRPNNIYKAGDREAFVQKELNFFYEDHNRHLADPSRAIFSQAYWDLVHKKHNYEYIFTGHVGHVWVHYISFFTGGYDFLDVNATHHEGTLPKELRFYSTDKRGRKIHTNLTLDEAYIADHIDDIDTLLEEGAQFEFEFNAVDLGSRVFLRNKGKVMELKLSEAKVRRTENPNWDELLQKSKQ